jgi:competence protein ComGC
LDRNAVNPIPAAWRSRRGFTLTAWLWCLAIIAALCLISVPLVRNESHEIGAKICRQELAEILAAKTKYALEHQLENGAEISMQTLLDAGSSTAPHSAPQAVSTASTPSGKTPPVRSAGHTALSRSKRPPGPTPAPNPVLNAPANSHS